jgi:hypothetical protein
MSTTEHCRTCTCADTWPPLPAGVTGQQIRHREVTTGAAYGMRPVRLGGAVPKVIIAETRTFVIYEAFSPSDGGSLGERAVPRDQFEKDFERKSGLQIVPAEDC